MIGGPIQKDEMDKHLIIKKIITAMTINIDENAAITVVVKIPLHPLRKLTMTRCGESKWWRKTDRQATDT